jgi:lipopolysaccharide/colanic/teichoic acid biosynthesis glycosyltransferase
VRLFTKESKQNNKRQKLQLFMHSNTQSADPASTYSHRLADIVGTMIGLLTLTLPLFVIDYYSSNSVQNDHQPITYNLNRDAD